MTTRNYERPDPPRVVANLTRVLSSGDMTLLEKGAYELLITHCGFIAHYNHRGFIETYRDDMPDFVEAFLTQLGMGWDTFLDNRRSYLYDVSYKNKLLADIIRDLLPVFRHYRHLLQHAHDEQVRTRELTVLRALAKKHGYALEPEEQKEDPQKEVA